jgi:hypothetical protein
MQVLVSTTVAASLLFCPVANAQSQTTSPLLSPGPKACPPDVATPPLAANQTNRSLSDQLSESKGVICPPAGIDPGLVEKPPATHDNPVISPPGSPGGNPNVVPK